MFPTPDPAEVDRIVSANAQRFPQKASIPVLGDHGAPDRLPILLGNPSGAVSSKDVGRVSPVWGEIVGGLLRQRLDVADIADRFAEDCLLLPDLHTFGAWRARYPRLANDIAVAALRKVGAVQDALVEPSAVEEPPKVIADALAANPRACWRWLRPQGERYAVAIDCPSQERYEAFTDALRRPDCDAVGLACDFAQGSVVAVDGAPEIGAVLGRFPGTVIWIATTARRLAGAIGEVRLGEW